MSDEIREIDESTALSELGKGFQNAETILNDEDKLEKLFQKLENKLKVFPTIGEKLAVAASMASMVKSYVRKEYTEVPMGTIIAAISALVYVVNPVDIIPDSIPVVGHADDVGIVAVCLKLIESDLQEYIEWRKKNGKEIPT